MYILRLLLELVSCVLILWFVVIVFARLFVGVLEWCWWRVVCVCGL